MTNVEPDPDQTLAFLEALYPRLPEGVVTYTTFTVTERSINVPQRLGIWTADNNNGRPATHNHEWLAARIHRSAQGARPTPEESAQHFPHVPITGAFLRLPTTMAEWPIGNQRGGQSNVCELVGFVLDGDYDVPGHHKRDETKLPLPPDADTVLDIWAQAVGKAPTLVWTTGGGINGAWLLETPVRLPHGEEGAALLKQWRAASGRFHDRVVRAANARDMHHDSVPNNDRLMRIPGTVNAKLGVEPKLARLVATDGPRYSLTELMELAPEPVHLEDGSLVDPITGELLRGPRPVAQAHAAGTARSTSDDGETPWDHYDREVWERGTFRDLLTRDGWTEERFHNGVLHFWRPGKGPGEQISATLGANEGVGALSYGAKFFVFSDNAPGLLGTAYKDQFLSPSLYRAIVQHGGDMKASAAELRRSGYGAPRVPAQAPAPAADAWADFQMPTFRSSDYKTVQDAEGNTRRVLTEAAKARVAAQMNGEAAPDSDGETAPDVPFVPGRIPPSFWDRRPVLQHIRQAAHSQCCSSDVFLYAYMARMSALIDHRIRINTGAKQPVCPNIYVGICARSGTNKSSSVAGARDLTYAPEHRDVLDGVPIGTGEGMAEGLMGTVMEDDPDGKVGKDGLVKQVAVRKQVRHNIFFDVDEGETLIRLGSRDGSSLWPSIRAAWTGGPLGQLNATAERNRVIPARSYTISMVVGFQYSNALKVIQDDETGTAQRFIWCNAVDPDIPMDPVDWPGEMPYCPQEMTLSLAQLAEGPKAQRLIEMPVELKRLIRRDIVLRGRGDESVDQDRLNAHANLSKAKLSALLALMEGRDEINMEDWELAEILWEASCELRAFLIDEARREAEEKQRERTEADLQKAVTIHTQKAAADRSIEIRARWVWEKVSAGARTLGELNKKLGSGVRHTLRPGVELAVVRDWVRLSDEGELSPGPSQPGKGT